MQERLLSTIALLAILAGLSILQPAQAAPKSKTAGKDRLVLMPLRVSDEDASLQGDMEAALVKGLQSRYLVFSGEQVQQKARQIFSKETKTAKHDCDETRCMQDIAEAFQSELIAAANVTKRADGYFLAITIRNIFDDTVVYSESTPCKGCDAYQVVDKLKQLAGGSTGSTLESKETSPAGSPAPRAADAETDLWEQVQKGNAAEDYNAYLSQYPKGKYATLAKTRLARLKQEAQAESDKQEKQAWEDAQNQNTVEGYKRYLSMYQKGRYAALAEARLQKIKSQDWGANWTADDKGCHAYNRYPENGDSISWTGACIKGYISGPGTLTWKVNGKYSEENTGTWLKGKQNGKGSWVNAEGDRYEGDYKDDDQTGNGIYTWADGNRYEGELLKDVPNGHGSYFEKSSGQTYVGEWKNGCYKSGEKTAWVGTTRESCGF